MEKIQLIFLIASLNISVLTAQQISPSPLVEAARTEVSALCTEEMAGRGYVDGGHKLAADYLSERFQEIGLTEVPGSGADQTPYQQSFLIRINLVSDATLQLGNTTYTPGDDFIANALSGAGEGTYKIKDLGYGLKAKASVRGKVAIIRDGWPEEFTNNTGKKAKYSSMAQTTDRIAALVPYEPAGIIVLKKKLTASFRSDKLAFPVLELKKDLYQKGNKQAKLSAAASVEVVRTQNVIGMLEGSVSPDTVIVICGHYDHLGKLGPAVFAGANDNASGIAMILSMAEHFAQPENQPRYSLLFIAFGAEETGLAGSRYYVENDPRISIKRTHFVLNLDLMGNGIDGVTAVGGKDYPKHFDQLVAVNEEIQAVPKVKSRANVPNSDHYFFLEQGVPGFFIYTLGGPPHYHDVNDTPANLEFSKFEEVRELLIRFIERL